VSRTRGKNVSRASYDSMSVGRFRLLISVMDAKTVHSVFRFIAWVLAIGASVVFVFVLASLFQRERARELVAEISRVMKSD
jgi:hypothetical protein